MGAEETKSEVEEAVLVDAVHFVYHTDPYHLQRFAELAQMSEGPWVRAEHQNEGLQN